MLKTNSTIKSNQIELVHRQLKAVMKLNCTILSHPIWRCTTATGRLKIKYTSNAFTRVHNMKGFVDICQLECVADKFINFQMSG